jgi:hypothetical protein
MEIMVEFHSLWNLPTAKKIAKALAPYAPTWFEDPIRMNSPQSLAEYAAVVPQVLRRLRFDLSACDATPATLLLTTQRGRRIKVFRDLNMESCTSAGLTLEPNASSMSIDCGLCDRHPKTCPAFFTVRHKGFENPAPDYFGYTRTGVRNGHLHERTQIPDLNGNRSLLAERFFCILNNIRKASRETALIERQIANPFSGQ